MTNRPALKLIYQHQHLINRLLGEQSNLRGLYKLSPRSLATYNAAMAFQRASLVPDDHISLYLHVTIRSTDGKHVLIHDFGKGRGERISIVAEPDETDIPVGSPETGFVTAMVVSSINHVFERWILLNGQPAALGLVANVDNTYSTEIGWTVDYDGLSYNPTVQRAASSADFRYTFWVEGTPELAWSPDSGWGQGDGTFVWKTVDDIDPARLADHDALSYRLLKDKKELT